MFILDLFKSKKKEEKKNYSDIKQIMEKREEKKHHKLSEQPQLYDTISLSSKKLNLENPFKIK